MRLFSTKRGNFQELVLGPLFPLIIVFAVMIILFAFVNTVSQSSYFEREFMTKDIGLMIEALQASPNDVSITYPNNEISKKLKITINKNFVQANEYNVDPLTAPSKVSKFLLLPSLMQVNDFIASPRVEKDQNGNDITYPYRLYFVKNQNGVTASIAQSSVPANTDEGYFKNLLNTAVSNWYQTPKVYIDTIYRPSSKQITSALTEQDLLKSLCTYLDITGGNGIYSTNACSYTTSLSERKNQAKDADFVIILYINEDKASKETIDVYYLDNNDEAGVKSQKMAGLSLLNLKTTFSDTQKKRIDEPLKSQIQEITGAKPAIIIEIGNLQNLKKEDVDNIAKPLYNAISAYYSQ